MLTGRGTGTIRNPDQLSPKIYRRPPAGNHRVTTDVATTTKRACETYEGQRRAVGRCPAAEEAADNSVTEKNTN